MLVLVAAYFAPHIKLLVWVLIWIHNKFIIGE